MKVLLITSQYIDIRDEECWCSYALYGTCENFLQFGTLYVAAARPINRDKTAQPLNIKMKFLEKEHVFFMNPTSKSIYSHFKNTSKNKKILKSLIPQMDLIICYGASWETLRIAHSYNIPVMTFVVGCLWDTYRFHQRWLVKILAPWSFIQAYFAIRNSDYVHYVTQEFLQRRYPTKGLSLACSDINLGQIDDTALQRRFDRLHNWDAKKNVVITTIGSIDARYKGQEYVMEAIAFLNSRFNTYKYHYNLIGPGNGEYLKEKSRELGLMEYVHFWGRQDINNVFKILDDTDVYIQPSLSEGLPRSVIEAMSRALPCIGFMTGGIPELLDKNYIVRKKDVKGIISKLLILENQLEYRTNAERNYKESYSYEHSLLQNRIKIFFSKIKSNIYERNISKNI